MGWDWYQHSLCLPLRLGFIWRPQCLFGVRVDGLSKKHKETEVRSTKKVKEAYVFLGLTLAFSYFVFWGPLALFKIPTISFVSDVKGPAWAIALFIVGGFVPSLLAIFLTWKKEGVPGLRILGRRIIQFKLGWRWYG